MALPGLRKLHEPFICGLINKYLLLGVQLFLRPSKLIPLHREGINNCGSVYERSLGVTVFIRLNCT